MIYEIAHIAIKAGLADAFEKGVAEAAPLFKRARGCCSFALERGIEQPLQYRLVVGWDTVEDHTQHFRNSADFQAWRGLVGHCFESPPQVLHTSRVLAAF